jgi:hypothetical protein
MTETPLALTAVVWVFVGSAVKTGRLHEPDEHNSPVPQAVWSAAFCVEQSPVLVVHTATWQTAGAGQFAALVHLAMHADIEPEIEQVKPLAQSEADAQLVLQVVPEQAKLFVQAWAFWTAHMPVEEHNPGSMTFSPEQLDAPHEMPLWYAHVPFDWQVPLHAATLPRQSLGPQQFALGMQVVAPPLVHALKPEAHVVQSPAPVQVKLPPHGTAGGGTQLPPLQVPAPTRFAPEQVALPQLVVVG